MAFDIPRGRVVPVDAIDVRLDSGPHPFEVANRDAIAANWQRETAANPALFNGNMVLLSALSYDGSALRGLCHEVRYATMLYWRKNKDDARVEHCFAHAALVSADNALVAIRMGRRTANPGRVYFAAGSFERQDFVEGRVDAFGNMEREVREETGLELSRFRADERFYLFSQNQSSSLIQKFWVDESAEAIAARIAAFVANESDPEIEGPVIIRSAEDRPPGLMPHMLEIMRWHFSEEG